MEKSIVQIYLGEKSKMKKIIKLKLNTKEQNNLALVLSQHKINPLIFKEKLSKIIIQFEKNLKININVCVYEGSKFEIELLRPSTGFLLSIILKHNSFKILDLYKIYLISRIKQNIQNTKKINILKSIIKCFNEKKI